LQLASSILIERSPQEVWAFLGDTANVAKWDRGVASVVEKTPVPRGVGFEFDTIAPDELNLPDKGHISYRISEVDPLAGRCVVQLTSRAGNARFFKNAEWKFDSQPEGNGTKLTCTATFTLRPQYFFLAPLLYLKRKAILFDLGLLKSAIEE
jgi:carbon monoxide dehydrogenase subunit G